MACTITLAPIAAELCASKPGLKPKMWWAKVEDLTSIGAAANWVVSTITPVATKGFYPLFVKRKDNGLESTPNETGGYTTELKGFLSKQEAAKSQILSAANGAEAFIFITEDQNGVKDIIGSLDHPVMATFKPTKSPANGYEMVAKWEEHADIPLTFGGTVPLAS